MAKITLPRVLANDAARLQVARQYLREANFRLESVAHLCNLESALLPSVGEIESVITAIEARLDALAVRDDTKPRI